MITAKDGSIADRALVDPDRNNFGPRLGFAYTPMRRPSCRGGWGLSYVHINRIGSANLLGINGPQVVRAAVNQTPTDAGLPADRAGLSLRLTNPSAFNPLTALVSYIPRDFHSSPVQSWYHLVQALRFGSEHARRRRVRRANRANRPAAGRQLTTRPHRTTPRGTIPLASRARFRPGPTSPTVNGGRCATTPLQVKYEWRMGDDLSLPQLADAFEGEGQRRRRAREPERQLPGASGHQQSDADYGLSAYHQPYNSTTSFVWSLPFGRGKRWGNGISSGLDVLVGGWQLAGINMITPGEMVTLTYSPAAAFQVSGITNDFSGANNYRPNISCDPYAADPSISAWFNPSCVSIPTDPSQPFGNAPRNNVRGPNFWQFDAAASKNVALGGSAKLQSGSRRSTSSTATTSSRRRAIAAPRTSAPSPVPSTPGRSSWV
jgi:hypothetical protein